MQHPPIRPSPACLTPPRSTLRTPKRTATNRRTRCRHWTGGHEGKGRVVPLDFHTPGKTDVQMYHRVGFFDRPEHFGHCPKAMATGVVCVFERLPWTRSKVVFPGGWRAPEAFAFELLNTIVQILGWILFLWHGQTQDSPWQSVLYGKGLPMRLEVW